MKIEKDLLALSAEYAVCSELCKRNIYAQLTFGHHKRADILIETKNNMLRIQVKGKQIKDWGNIKGIYGKDTILIFVDFEKKEKTDRPDFYILTEEDWINLLRNSLKTSIEKGEVVITENNVPVWPNQNNYEGTSVYPAQINTHKDLWDKILQLC